MLTKRRSIQVKVTLTPDLHERLRSLAVTLGQAPATVASLAIGQYVANMTNTLGASARMTESIAAQVGATLTEEMNRQMKLADAIDIEKLSPSVSPLKGKL